MDAASPDYALQLVAAFIDCAQNMPIGSVQSGEFGANMQVSLVNDGPVTIVLNG